MYKMNKGRVSVLLGGRGDVGQVVGDARAGAVGGAEAAVGRRDEGHELRHALRRPSEACFAPVLLQIAAFRGIQRHHKAIYKIR